MYELHTDIRNECEGRENLQGAGYAFLLLCENQDDTAKIGTVAMMKMGVPRGKPRLIQSFYSIRLHAACL